MTVSEWISLALVCSLGAFSPGPSLLVIINCTILQGKKAGYFASIGHGLGVFIYAYTSALGLTIILINSQKLFLAVQFLGAILLLWIGIKTISNRNNKKNYNTNNNYTKKLNKSFLDGFLIAIFNPKIATFFLSLFSQFLNQKQGNVTHLFMAVLAGGIDVSAYLIMVYLVSTNFLNTFLIKYSKFISIGFGVFLILLALSLFYSFF